MTIIDNTYPPMAPRRRSQRAQRPQPPVAPSPSPSLVPPPPMGQQYPPLSHAPPLPPFPGHTPYGQPSAEHPPVGSQSQYHNPGIAMNTAHAYMHPYGAPFYPPVPPMYPPSGPLVQQFPGQAGPGQPLTWDYALPMGPGHPLAHPALALAARETGTPVVEDALERVEVSVGGSKKGKRKLTAGATPVPTPAVQSGKTYPNPLLAPGGK